MTNKKTKFKLFRELFSDNNSLNEKTIAGFAALCMMIFAMIVDLITGLQGLPMPINQFIFDGFLYIVLGAFGIASIDKIFGKNIKKEENNAPEEVNNY
jgi:hypothetical protein